MSYPKSLREASEMARRCREGNAGPPLLLHCPQCGRQMVVTARQGRVKMPCACGRVIVAEPAEKTATK